MSAFLNDFQETVTKATEKLRAMPEREARERPSPDKWCAKEIIGHLIDSASNNHARFVNAQLGDEMVFDGYAQDEWVRLQRYREAPWQDLLDLWSSFNLHIIRLVGAIPPELRTRERRKHNLARIAWETVPSDEPVTLDYFIRDYLAHLKHHLRQIDPDLSKVPDRQRSDY